MAEGRDDRLSVSRVGAGEAPHIRHSTMSQPKGVKGPDVRERRAPPRRRAPAPTGAIGEFPGHHTLQPVFIGKRVENDAA